jgi:hypothetical protein
MEQRIIGRGGMEGDMQEIIPFKFLHFFVVFALQCTVTNTFFIVGET